MKNKNSLWVALILGLVPNLGTAQDPFCQIEMENAAIYSSSMDFKASVNDIRVLRFDMGPWTEKVSDNTGTGEVAVHNPMAKGTSYFRVSAKQIRDTQQCDVTDVMQLDPTKIESFKKLAENFKRVIHNSVYMSETDARWTAFYSDGVVSEGMPLEEVKRALRVGLVELQELSHQEVLDDLSFYTVKNGYSYEDQLNYKDLRDLLKKEFQWIKGYKTGKPDSGARHYFIVGRTKDGHLVGLRTLSIET